MLSMSDTSIDQFIPIFAEIGAKVAFLVPTPTGYKKSIMDAIGSVRSLFKESGLHDYELQGQGPENKVKIISYFVNSNSLTKTSASLYRPMTKKGDPRIWFSNLKKYCGPKNLLALIIYNKNIYVINLSRNEIALSLFNHGYVYDIIKQSVYEDETIARELLEKIFNIHQQGFLPSITEGDPGVGDTLEHALGIKRNNSKLPDYKGIELKCTRLTRNGKKRSKTRVNLFAKVPDGGLNYSEIVKKYGRWVFNEKKQEDRLSLENTIFASHPNSFGLILYPDNVKEELDIYHSENDLTKQIVSYWYLTTLKKRLLEKHHETFWVQAESRENDGWEYFRYDKVIHTKNPNDSLILPLVEIDKIQVDMAGYFIKQKKMKWRDHGMLFKMWPDDLPLLFGVPREYNLIDMEREQDIFMADSLAVAAETPESYYTKK